jgi:hypothetical protein
MRSLATIFYALLFFCFYAAASSTNQGNDNSLLRLLVVLSLREAPFLQPAGNTALPGGASGPPEQGGDGTFYIENLKAQIYQDVIDNIKYYENKLAAQQPAHAAY